MDRRPVNIHDRAKIEGGLKHTLAVVNAYRTMQGKLDTLIDEAKALASATKRYLRHRGEGSKYKPHQGPKECARRAEQLRKGQIYDHFTRASHTHI